eukprot:TRINITY_DN31931_c0_g1_i1.p1 TRINITY_DN31931_c0_g1~~TRINITY_DN31931_c0_g1_i1.p1  ORF type:complete len:101 (-),score=30.23 TRINITY_DN31931_c0_g1_i1:398-700(-)
MEVGLGPGQGDWGQRWVLKDNIGDIKHIESDGEWLVVATKHDIKVFKMEVDNEPSFVGSIPDVATNVALAYPVFWLSMKTTLKDSEFGILKNSISFDTFA